jgi:hypothetical protein
MLTSFACIASPADVKLALENIRTPAELMFGKLTWEFKKAYLTGALKEDDAAIWDYIDDDFKLVLDALPEELSVNIGSKSDLKSLLTLVHAAEEDKANLIAELGWDAETTMLKLKLWGSIMIGKSWAMLTSPDYDFDLTFLPVPAGEEDTTAWVKFTCDISKQSWFGEYLFSEGDAPVLLSEKWMYSGKGLAKQVLKGSQIAHAKAVIHKLNNRITEQLDSDEETGEVDL